MPDTIRIAAGATAWQVQSAIDRAPAHAVIQLAAGSYNFSRTVVIERDDVTLTGAGAGRTVITADAELDGAPAIRVGAELFVEDKSDPIGMHHAAAGARSIRLDGSGTLRPGDTIWIEQANDRALFDKIGDDLWRGETPLRTALAVVTAVKGDVVTLDRALPFTFQSKGTTVEKIDTTRNVAVENLTLRGDHGMSDAGDFRNTLPGQDGAMMLLVNATDNTSLRNVEISQPASHGLVIAKSLDARVADVSVRGAHEKGDGGNGYGIWLRDVYDSDLRDLTVFDTRHALLFASHTSAARNTVHISDTNRDVNFHGGLDRDNTVIVDNALRTLTEAAYLGAVSYINAGTTFGAPTDPDANTLVYRNVLGTVRADVVHAAGGGATIATRGGSDTIFGGNGSDVLSSGTGDDFIFSSRGFDRVNGGDGADTVRFNSRRSDLHMTEENGALVVRGSFGVTELRDVEGVSLENGWYRVADLLSQAHAYADEAF